MSIFSRIGSVNAAKDTSPRQAGLPLAPMVHTWRPARVDLSDDQNLARKQVLAALSAGQLEIVLSGPAGSGKSTLMKTLVADIERTSRCVRLLAPTGKAAARLRDLTQHNASTIHSVLYKNVRERADESLEFSNPVAVADGNDVLIVDEASMVGMSLSLDLRRTLSQGAQILWVGDKEQLQPVGEPQGPNFDEPTAILTQVHRQAAGSPIIDLATAIRLFDNAATWRKAETSATDKGSYTKHVECNGYSTFDHAADWLVSQRKDGKDATLLAYSNATRRRLNYQVRQALGRGGEYLDVGDRVLCFQSNKRRGIFNGEVRVVKNMELFEDHGTNHTLATCFFEGGDSAILAIDLLENGCDSATWRKLEDKMDENDARWLLRCEYGECLTIHKAQGSQWDAVGIVYDGAMRAQAKNDPADFKRLIYTGVTRAARDLHIFEVW